MKKQNGHFKAKAALKNNFTRLPSDDRKPIKSEHPQVPLRRSGRMTTDGALLPPSGVPRRQILGFFYSRYSFCNIFISQDSCYEIH
jgi:hypothetical protein